MPLYASCRARCAGGDLRVDGGGAFGRRLRGFAAAIAAAGVALGAAAPACADTQIYIAGPGARGNADAAQMNAALAAPVSPSAPASAVLASMRRSPEPAAEPGTITIPGPGERTADAQTGAPNVITIPGPGEAGAASAVARPATFPARPVRSASAALPRQNAVSAADGVAQVVVNPAANGASATQMANATQAAGAPNPATVAAQPASALSAPVPPGQEDGETIRTAALTFLQQQSAGLPGHVGITVSPVFPRGLAACTSLETFLPPGARTWGHTTVGVRCVGAKPWTLYVAARIAVDVTYYLASRQINPGEALNAMDLTAREGDLANLPQTVVTDPTQAIGAVALMRISPGLPLRTDMLRSASSVVIGQTVKLIAVGPNFSISADGQVLNNAAPGQQVRVRTAEGQIVTGVVKDAATVQVQI